MRPAHTTRFAVVALMLSLMTSGCAQEEATPADDEDLVRQYLASTDVRNDRFPSPPDFTTDDRRADLAARGTPQNILNELFSPFPCGGELRGLGTTRVEACDIDGAAMDVAQDFAGTDGVVWGRSILVKHGDPSLELITVLVAANADGDTLLVDSTGETYDDGLDDFRSNNDLLSPSDLIRVPRNLDAIPGEGRIVTVSGHTVPSRWPWVFAGIGATAVLGIGLVARRITRARAIRAFEARTGWGPPA